MQSRRSANTRWSFEPAQAIAAHSARETSSSAPKAVARKTAPRSRRAACHHARGRANLVCRSNLSCETQRPGRGENLPRAAGARLVSSNGCRVHRAATCAPARTVSRAPGCAPSGTDPGTRSRAKELVQRPTTRVIDRVQPTWVSEGCARAHIATAAESGGVTDTDFYRPSSQPNRDRTEGAADPVSLRICIHAVSFYHKHWIDLLIARTAQDLSTLHPRPARAARSWAAARRAPRASARRAQPLPASAASAVERGQCAQRTSPPSQRSSPYLESRS